MSDRVTVHGLQVSPVLYDFINTEALPGTGVDQDAFWSGAAAVVGEYAPRNRELLAIRDDLLQAAGQVSAVFLVLLRPEYEALDRKSVV